MSSALEPGPGQCRDGALTRLCSRAGRTRGAPATGEDQDPSNLDNVRDRRGKSSLPNNDEDDRVEADKVRLPLARAPAVLRRSGRLAHVPMWWPETSNAATQMLDPMFAMDARSRAPAAPAGSRSR